MWVPIQEEKGSFFTSSGSQSSSGLCSVRHKAKEMHQGLEVKLLAIISPAVILRDVCMHKSPAAYMKLYRSFLLINMIREVNVFI